MAYRPLDALMGILVLGLLVLGVWLALHQGPLREDLTWPHHPSRNHCWAPAPEWAGCK